VVANVRAARGGMTGSVCAVLSARGVVMARVCAYDSLGVRRLVYAVHTGGELGCVIARVGWVSAQIHPLIV
jgi:heme O synthase-like polyprenyltransferase